MEFWGGTAGVVLFRALGRVRERGSLRMTETAEGALDLEDYGSSLLAPGFGRSDLPAAPFEVGVPVACAGHAHLEFAGHEGAFALVGEAEPGAGAGLGEEDDGGGRGGGDVVVEGVAFVVEVDGLEWLAGGVPEEVEQVAVLAVEAGGGFAAGVGGGVAGEDVAVELADEGVTAAGLGAAWVCGFGFPGAFEKARADQGSGLAVGAAVVGVAVCAASGRLGRSARQRSGARLSFFIGAKSLLVARCVGWRCRMHLKCLADRALL